MNYKEITLEKLSIDIDVITKRAVEVALEEQRKVFQKEIEEQKSKIEKLKTEKDDILNIQKDETGKYMRLDDFCRVTRDLLAINVNSIKQYLHANDILARDEKGKYIPNANDKTKTARLIDGDLYVKELYVRQLLLVRSFTAIGSVETIGRMLNKFEAKKDVVMESLSNTVVVDYKQNSFEFRNLEGSKYNLLG